MTCPPSVNLRELEIKLSSARTRIERCPHNLAGIMSSQTVRSATDGLYKDDLRSICMSSPTVSLMFNSTDASAVAAACADTLPCNFSKSQMLETMHVISSAQAPTSSCLCSTTSRRLTQRVFCARSRTTVVRGVAATPLSSSFEDEAAEAACSSAISSWVICRALRFEKMSACMGVRRSCPMHWVNSLNPATTE